MKKNLLLACMMFSVLSSVAQIADGFYRVRNYKTLRYVYVYDNTGKINYNTTGADMGAIYLHSDAERRLSDPASVLYASKKGQSGANYLYDLEAQGTGVHSIIDNYYVTVAPGDYAGAYKVFEPSYNIYLWDRTRSLSAKDSYIGTDPVQQGSTILNEYRNWNIFPLQPKGDEYLGLAPDANMQLNGKYYKPYYLGFAFDFASAGMKAYYISEIKADAVIIREITGTVPAKTPVIVECSSALPTNNRVELYYTTPAVINGNKLSGNFFCYNDHGPTAYKTYDANTMRVLAIKDGQLQYVKDTEAAHLTKLEFVNGSKTDTKICLKANESYLVVPTTADDALPVYTEEEYKVVSILSHNAISTDNKKAYDLSGRSINNNAKGLQIVNGKKLIK